MKYQVCFLRENMISLHMKMCYGKIRNHAFAVKKNLGKMLWYFIGVYINNK